MIKVRQSCEMCGKERNLPMATRTRESPDRGGWRLLSYGALEATLCDVCVRIVVEHALLRARMRLHRGEEPEGEPLRLQFSERAHE